MAGRLPPLVGAASGVLLIGLTLAACGGGGETPRTGSSAGVSLSATASATPTPVTPAPGDHDLSLVVDGFERKYRVHAPPGYKPGKHLPLVVAFHCRPCDISDIEQLSSLSSKADKERFIVVYPQGPGRKFGSSDVPFVEKLLDEVESTWGTDPHRVYATGFSNGASMSFRVAVDLPGRFAAIAPVSGPLNALGGPQLGRVPTVPLSMVVFSGKSDGVVDRSVGEDLGEIMAELGCAKPSVKRTRSGQPMTVTSTTCPGGMDVDWYSVGGMGHGWPGADDPHPPVEATDVMWDFFSSHPGTA